MIYHWARTRAPLTKGYSLESRIHRRRRRGFRGSPSPGWEHALAGQLAQNWLARGLGELEDRLTGDPVDLAHLARFTLGSATLEREVLQLFAEQMPLYLEALRTGQVHRAWSEAAHNIKGSACAIGAWRLARCAERAERVEVEGEAAAPEEQREEVVVAVARAAEEACRFIGRRLAGS